MRCLLITALLLAVAAPVQPVRAGEELQRYQQRLQRLFETLDRNGDGRLDREEARVNAYLRRHFERLDRDGRGFLLPSDLR